MHTCCVHSTMHVHAATCMGQYTEYFKLTEPLKLVQLKLFHFASLFIVFVEINLLPSHSSYFQFEGS